jgi:anti-anti-sigma factor
MEVTESRAGNATTLRVVGRFDSSVSKIFEDKVGQVISRADVIILDLGDMIYVSSAGLRSFITLAKHARAKNQKVSLCAMREEITEVFEISGLLELFAIYDSVEAAVSAQPR